MCADKIPPSPEELGNNQMSPLWWEIYSPLPPGISCLCTQDDNILSLPWWTSSVKEEVLCYAETRTFWRKVWWQTGDPEQKRDRKMVLVTENLTKASRLSFCAYEKEPFTSFIFCVVHILYQFFVKSPYWRAVLPNPGRISPHRQTCQFLQSQWSAPSSPAGHHPSVVGIDCSG